MRVTLDVSAAALGRGGIGRYCDGLASTLAARDDVELTLFRHGRGPSHLAPALRGLPMRRVPLGSKPWRAGVAAAELLGIPLDGLVRGDGLFHATDHLLPPLRRVPSVFTVHDLAFLTHPETHRASNQAFLARLVPRFCRAPTLVIADSESTRQDLLRLYGLAPERVHTVHLGVEPRFRPLDPAAEAARVRERHGLDGAYLLFVGTLEPRKNLRRLLAAYHALLRQRAPGARPLLAIAGAPGWWYAGLHRAVQERGLERQVRFLGRVPDDDLPALYSAASAFVYPSLYEGFGLPPLEALACGAPVVCSNVSSLPEVVGDAALLVDPRDVGALAAALARALDDSALRATLQAGGPVQASRFTWERAAAATMAVYRLASERWQQRAAARRRA